MAGPPARSRLKPNSLPAELTRVAGRRRELSEVKRLLTPTDSDEAGKTGLALRAAGADGAWLPRGRLVVFAGHHQRSEPVIQAVFSTLGLPDTPSGRLLPTLRH